MSTDVIDPERIKVVDLHPDDVVVYQPHFMPGPKMLESIKEVLTSLFPDNVVLVINPKDELKVVRPEVVPEPVLSQSSRETQA